MSKFFLAVLAGWLGATSVSADYIACEIEQGAYTEEQMPVKDYWDFDQNSDVTGFHFIGKDEFQSWLLSNDGLTALINALGCKLKDWRLTAIRRQDDEPTAWIFRIVNWYRSADTIDYSGDGVTLQEAIVNAILDSLGVKT